jgi:hypothetical protein
MHESKDPCKYLKEVTSRYLVHAENISWYRSTRENLENRWKLLIFVCLNARIREGGHVRKLTTHIHLVLRLRMHGAVPVLPHTSLWSGA